MNPEWVRERCLSFPSATEHVIWGNDLTFKIAGKIFAHLVLEPAPVWLSFKTTPENFYELTERQNIIPAPYMARASYVALQTRDALTAEELAALLRESYELVVARLPKKTRELLAGGVSVGTPAARKKTRKAAGKRSLKESPKRASRKPPAPKRKKR
ncbi:MAG: MmcQ/YjbR family DNA-binding protein [Candidatus Acidiferrum sp.]|jgi:predicted DNA-binding protein (MmcQ/YjbR family)